MVGLYRTRCLSAALVVLCIHTVSSSRAYGSSGSNSAAGHYRGSSEEYSRYGRNYPSGPFVSGGPSVGINVYGGYPAYIGPNDRRGPGYPAPNPIPQPPIKGGRFYTEPFPAVNFNQNAPFGKPFPQSGYPAPGPYPQPGPYPSKPFPSEPYPSEPYPQPPVAPIHPKSAPYPPVEPYPHPPVDPRPVIPYPPVEPYPHPPVDPRPVIPYPPVEPYPHPPVDPRPVIPYPPVEPYPHPPVDPRPVIPYPPVEPYPHPPVGPKPSRPYPPVEPYPVIPVHPKPVHPYPNPGVPFNNKGFPDVQIQGPRPYHPAPVKPRLPSSLCDNCKFKNGVGYNPFPNSCQSYVTCQQYDGYKLLPTKMHCPYNLFWNQKILTCVRPKNYHCPYDACLAGKGSKTAGVYGNCAAYHVCGGYGRTSAIYCCAYGFRYQPSQGYTKPGYQPCVRDPSCSDSCAPKKTPIRKEKCRLLPVRGHITQYQELVHWKYIIRYCAPGTAFVQKDCGCTARVKVHRKAGCNAEVYIDFKYGIRDVSGNFVSVGNEWDRVKSVKSPGARDGFAGQFYNGQLILWRFANAPLGPPLKMAFVFQENAYKKGGFGGKNEVLVSNGDCGKPASVSVTFDRSSQTVTALVDTKFSKNYKPAYVSVPYQPGKYKEVVYSYDGKYLTLSVNGKSKSVAARGDVQVRQCALSLGGVKGGTAFYGLLDDFKLFLCAPKPVAPYPTKPHVSVPVFHPAGPGPHPAGPGPYPVGPGPYSGGKDTYPVGPGPYSGGKDTYPVGPGPYSGGKDTYPVGPGPYPGGKDTYPVGPGPYSGGKDTYPVGPGPYPGGKDTYPVGPDPYSGGKDTYPVGPGPYSGGKDTYPVGPGPYPGGKDTYPVGPGPYSGGKDTYPVGPGPYSGGKDTYPVGPGPYSDGKDTYPVGPGPYSGGKDTYPVGPGPYSGGKDIYPVGPGPYPAGPAPYPNGKQAVSY